MRATAVFLALTCLVLCGGTQPSRAELQFQSSIEQWCRPAMPTGHTILRWKQPNSCGNDCFDWRLSCANGKAVMLESKNNPATTKLQQMFAYTLPWSFLMYLVPFVLVIGVASIGSQLAWPLLAANALFLTYAAYAAWYWIESITGNPFGLWAEWQRLLFLSPYVFWPVVAVWALLNLPALLRGLEEFFYRHPTESVMVPAMWVGHPAQAVTMSAALMPHMHEYADPSETASYYHRQTEQVYALKDKLNAEAALAEAISRRERARRQLNDHF